MSDTHGAATPGEAAHAARLRQIRTAIEIYGGSCLERNGASASEAKQEALDLVAAALDEVATLRTERDVWRCFHCDEVFTDRTAALDHFGPDRLLSTPGCQIDVAEYRRMEEVFRRSVDEDTDLHRQIRSLRSDLDTAVRRAEEDGYAKGLADASATIIKAESLQARVAQLEQGGGASDALALLRALPDACTNAREWNAWRGRVNVLLQRAALTPEVPHG